MVSSICFNVVPWYGHIDFFWSFEIMFRYQYQPCSCQSQVWLPWHHQGFQVQHLWRPWEMGPGLDFFPDFVTMRGFPKIGVPQNGWFIMENTIKMDDLEVPLFSETSMTFQEKQRFFRASSLAKRQAGSNVAVPGADLNVGMNSSCQFSQGILGVSEFEIVCFLQKWWLKWMFDGTSTWRNADVNWKILSNFRSLCDNSDKNSRKTESPQKKIRIKNC